MPGCGALQFKQLRRVPAWAGNWRDAQNYSVGCVGAVGGKQWLEAFDRLLAALRGDNALGRTVMVARSVRGHRRSACIGGAGCAGGDGGVAGQRNGALAGQAGVV